MRLLLIGDAYNGYGSEIFALNLIGLFKKHGWDVRYIYFHGSIVDAGECIKIELNSGEKQMGRFIEVPSVKSKLHRNIKAYSPDLIILNNPYLVPFSIISVVKKYKVIRIIHDCRCICHAGLCLNNEMQICRGYKFGDCYKCGKHGHKKFSKAHVWIKCFIQKRLNLAYQKGDITSVFPSEWLREYCMPYGITGITVNNFINTYNLCYIPSPNRKKYVYIGALSVFKGIGPLLMEFDRFSQNKDVELYLAGPLDKDTTVLLEEYKENTKIHYIGVIPHDKIAEILVDKYCLIMPSLIMDNYPTAVIEGMMSGKLIIGSNRGGIPEMISEDGLLFDPGIDGDLLRKLELSQTMDDALIKTKILNAYERMKNMTGEYYFTALMHVYSKL